MTASELDMDAYSLEISLRVLLPEWRRALWLDRGFDGVKFLARLEADSSAWRDVDLGSSARIATDTGLSRTNGKDSETAQFDPVALGERLFQAFKDTVNSGFRFCAWQACPLNHLVDDILLDQGQSPFGLIDSGFR